MRTETREEPDCASYTVTTSTTSDEDIAEMLDGLIELQEPTPSILDIITGAAGIASIIASVCLIAKTIKRKYPTQTLSPLGYLSSSKKLHRPLHQSTVFVF